MIKCLVCGNEATDVTVPTFDGRTISCGRCETFDVSGTVGDAGLLADKEPEERLAALARAKARAEPGKRPMITSLDL